MFTTIKERVIYPLSKATLPTIVWSKRMSTQSVALLAKAHHMISVDLDLSGQTIFCFTNQQRKGDLLHDPNALKTARQSIPWCMAVWQYGVGPFGTRAPLLDLSLRHCSQFIAFLGHNFARGCIQLLDALLDKDQLYINRTTSFRIIYKADSTTSGTFRLTSTPKGSQINFSMSQEPKMTPRRLKGLTGPSSLKINLNM